MVQYTQYIDARYLISGGLEMIRDDDLTCGINYKDGGCEILDLRFGLRLIKIKEFHILMRGRTSRIIL